jgi:hypothetical protein
LFHLIGLSLRTFTLKIYLLVDACFAEHVVTASDSFREAESQQQRTDVFETYICIASTTQHLLERFLVLAHRAERVARRPDGDASSGSGRVLLPAIKTSSFIIAA